MDICHAHNLLEPLGVTKPFGIRVRMQSNDTFARLLGTDWQREYWYATGEERDHALREMAGEHLYSRVGDKPTLIYEPIEQSR
jgi:hypothetical protein